MKKLKTHFQDILNRYGFVGIETVVIAALVLGFASFMGYTLKKAGDETTEESLIAMSDDNAYDGETQISNLVEQVLFYRKDNISNTNPNFDNQTRLTAVQMPVGGYVDILAGIFPSNATNKKLKYTVTVNPDVVTISDYGWTSATGYPTFRIQGKPNKAGYVQLKACSTDGSNVCGTLNVTVGTPAAGISVDKTSVILNVNKSANLTVAPIPDDATVQEITWADTNNKLKDIVYNPVSNKLTIVGKEVGTTTLKLFLTDEPFGGTVYEKEIEVYVRDGIDGVIVKVDDPIEDSPAQIALNWALSRGFTVRAENTTNIRIEKFQYFVSDERIIDPDKLLDSQGWNWKDYINGSNITKTGTYVYFRACQAKEDVQEWNGENECGRAFRFVLAVDTTVPEESDINTYRKDSTGVIPSTDSGLSALGIAKLNNTGEYVTTRWDKNVLYDIVTQKDAHSGFSKIEYQIGDAKAETNSTGDIEAINDDNAEWGVYEGDKFQTGKWATYTNKSLLDKSGWRIRFRVCDKLGNGRSLGSRAYLVDNENPLSFKVTGVDTNNSTGWTTNKTITVSDMVDRHSGAKHINYCVKNTLDAECKWNSFDKYNGKSFGVEGLYIMFQIVDDMGLTYTDGTNYVLNVENSAPKILNVKGASADGAWATQRNFSIETSRPLSTDINYYYALSDNGTSFGRWNLAGTLPDFNVTNSGKKIKFKICLNHITSICSAETAPYNLFVDTTKPTINSVSGGSTNFEHQRKFTFGITEIHSGINRIEFATNTSFTDKQTCPDSNKNECTISKLSLKQVYFRVIDNVGNISAVSAPQNVYIDNTPPSSSGIASGASTTWSKSKTITFKNSSDNFTPVSYQYCASSNTADCSTYNSSRYANNGTSNTVTINSGTAKYIYVVACDSVGNCTTPAQGNLYVDNTVPSISVTGGGAYWSTSKNFSIWLGDTNSYKSSTPNAVSYTSGQSQIASYTIQYYYSGGTYSGWINVSASVGDSGTLAKTLAEHNAEQVRFFATDKAGNETAWTGWYGLYTQTSFSISGSGSWSWSNASGRTITLSSTCKGTTTYSFTDGAGWDSSTATTRWWDIAWNTSVWSGTVNASCMGMSTSTSVPIYIDRQPPSVWADVQTRGTCAGNWCEGAYIGFGSSDAGSGISWTTGSAEYYPSTSNGTSVTPSWSRDGCTADLAGNQSCTTGKTWFGLSSAYKAGTPTAKKLSNTHYQIYRDAYVVQALSRYTVSEYHDHTHSTTYSYTTAERNQMFSGQSVKKPYFTSTTPLNLGGGPKGADMYRKTLLFIRGTTQSIKGQETVWSGWSS